LTQKCVRLLLLTERRTKEEEEEEEEEEEGGTMPALTQIRAGSTGKSSDDIGRVATIGRTGSKLREGHLFVKLNLSAKIVINYLKSLITGLNGWLKQVLGGFMLL
jgi:hypothetical protein